MSCILKRKEKKIVDAIFNCRRLLIRVSALTRLADHKQALLRVKTTTTIIVTVGIVPAHSGGCSSTHIMRQLWLLARLFTDRPHVMSETPSVRRRPLSSPWWSAHTTIKDFR